jgi:hypothetical protein
VPWNANHNQITITLGARLNGLQLDVSIDDPQTMQYVQS